MFKNHDGGIDKVVIPVRGFGLWGTLYGYLALESDLSTIAGLGFYQHKETPGLGGEVDNPKWARLARQLYDDYRPTGRFRGSRARRPNRRQQHVGAMHYRVRPSLPAWVKNLVNFVFAIWAGPFLQKLKAQQMQAQEFKNTDGHAKRSTPDLTQTTNPDRAAGIGTVLLLAVTINMATMLHVWRLFSSRRCQISRYHRCGNEFTTSASLCR